jgi:hypothetical protein
MVRVCLPLMLAACTCGPAERERAPPDSSAGDGEPVDQGPCVDPQPILTVDGAATGYERCADGSVNRVENGVVLGGDYGGDVPECEDHVAYRNCDADADCQDPPGGHCAKVGPYLFPASCECTWPCASDIDCTANEVCLPPEVHDLPLSWPLCVPAKCRTGATCSSGECAVATLRDCGWGMAELRCRKDTDTCRSNLECDEGAHFCWAYGDHMECEYEACD